MLNDRNRVVLATALAPLIWGTTYLATTELLPPGRPLLAALLRALPAGVVLVALSRRLPHGSWWWRSAVLGALNIGAFFALLFVAAYRLPGGIAAIIVAMQPLLVAGLASVLLSERVTARTAVAGVAGLAGICLLVLRATVHLDGLGVAAAAGAAVVMACGVVLSKRWTSPAPLLATTGWQLTAGGLGLLPVTLLVEGPPRGLSVANLSGYGYLAVGSAITYALWFRGIRALSASSVIFLGLLSPVMATALGWLALSQALTVPQALGGLIVLITVVAAQGQKPRQRDALKPTPPCLAATPAGHHSTCNQELTTMQITVFGATGDVGRRVVAEALARGHEVTAVARNPIRLRELPGGADARAGDAASVEDVIALSEGQDVVISATRPAAGHESEHVTTTKALLAGLARTGVRLLLVGGAANLTVPGTGGATVLDDPDFPADWRAIALACNAQLEACHAELDVDWAYLSPAALLTPGERTGRYRLGADELITDPNGDSMISMEDLAVALLDEAEQPTHHQARFTAAY